MLGRFRGREIPLRESFFRSTAQHPVRELPDGAPEFLVIFRRRAFQVALPRLIDLRQESVIDFVGRQRSHCSKMRIASRRATFLALLRPAAKSGEF